MYLENESNNNSFYQLRKKMFIDDRIMKDKEGGHMAVILYGAFEDRISLSKHTAVVKGDKKYIDENGVIFCCFPQDHAEDELSFSQNMFKSRKKFLKKIGLITFPEQAEKKAGVASRIYVTTWEQWVETNGLYANGVWIVEPSSDNYYNPDNIVKAKPRFIKKIEQQSVAEDYEPTMEDIEEHETLMTKAKAWGVKFHKAERMYDMLEIIREHLGANKKLTEAKVEDLPAIRVICKTLEEKFNEVELPDYQTNPKNKRRN